jgi:hypothetical protein
MLNSITETSSNLILRLETNDLQHRIQSNIHLRSEERNYTFPIITDLSEGGNILDINLIDSINEDNHLLNDRTQIMEDLSQNRHSYDLVRLLVRQATPDIRRILEDLPNHIENVSHWSPVINIIVLSSIGLNDINLIFQEITAALLELSSENLIPNIVQDNPEIIRNRLKNIDLNHNIEVENDRQERNEERESYFRIDWREYARRGYNLVIATASTLLLTSKGRAQLIGIVSIITRSEKAMNLLTNPGSLFRNYYMERCKCFLLKSLGCFHSTYGK